jgi:hypothetical protein
VWLSRRDLQVGLWPELFGAGAGPDLDKLDRRLRQPKAVLSRIFCELPTRAGLPSDPIESLRTRTDTDGGYRIDVSREQVLFLS